MLLGQEMREEWASPSSGISVSCSTIILRRSLNVLADNTMIRATFATALDPPWTRIEPLRLGRVPTGCGTADRFVVVESNEGPLLRVDLYGSSHPFEEVVVWSKFVVIGWGDFVYLIDLSTQAIVSLDLDSYFGHLYPSEQYLLVAAAERLFCVQPDGTQRWRSERLGLDGVVITLVANGVVRGEGEWDPPDGDWRPFQLCLQSGQNWP